MNITDPFNPNGDFADMEYKNAQEYIKSLVPSKYRKVDQDDPSASPLMQIFTDDEEIGEDGWVTLNAESYRFFWMCLGYGVSDAIQQQACLQIMEHELEHMVEVAQDGEPFYGDREWCDALNSICLSMSYLMENYEVGKDWSAHEGKIAMIQGDLVLHLEYIHEFSMMYWRVHDDDFTTEESHEMHSRKTKRVDPRKIYIARQCALDGVKDDPDGREFFRGAAFFKAGLPVGTHMVGLKAQNFGDGTVDHYATKNEKIHVHDHPEGPMIMVDELKQVCGEIAKREKGQTAEMRINGIAWDEKNNLIGVDAILVEQGT